MKKILLLVMAFYYPVLCVWAQDRAVTGRVTSAENGEPLPGVNVIVKGSTAIGTITDIDGKFKINVPEMTEVLSFTFIGMKTREVSISGQSNVNVVLETTSKQLEELVVTALGVSREKKAVGYAVQNVSGEEVSKASEPNLVNALQGQVAGVQIQGTSGALGGSSRITIRGSNSFLGENQPLFVVDGMPINNDNYASDNQLRGFGGGAYDYGNNASDINPQDIASITVLKGAAATAQYGTRGSNGVILITTKSGKGNRGIGVDVNSSLTFERPFALIEHQKKYGGGAVQATSSGFQEFVENGTIYYAPIYGKDGSWGPKYDPNVLVRHWDSWDRNSPNYGKTRPWVAPENDYSDFFETGVTNQNSIGLSGGNDKGDFRLSYARMGQTGILPNSSMEKNTVSFNASYKLTDKLKAFSSGSWVVQNAEGRNATGYSNRNPMLGFTQWWQTQLDVDRLRDYERSDGLQHAWNPRGIAVNPADGTLKSFDPTPKFFDNPYWVRYSNLQEDVRDRFFGNVGVSYEFVDGLSLMAKGMADGFTFRMREGVANGGISQSDYTERIRTFRETNLEAKLMYNKDFSEDFSLNAFLGGNRMHQERNYTYASVNGGLALDGFFNLENGIGNPTITHTKKEKAINSIFTSASLGFRSLVFLDLALRNDWSSTLPKANNSYLYPSISTSFVFSELPLLQHNDVISFAKFRAGYGTAANDAEPYKLSSVYEPVSPNFGTAPRYAVPNVRNNPDLKPEYTREFELGLEMNFLMNRLGFDFTYYNRNTKDQIFEVATSVTTGYADRFLNAGSMKNSGIEMVLRGTPIQKAFQWDVHLNFGTFNNEVVELAEGVKNLRIAATWGAHLSIEKGRPYMALMGTDYERNEKGQIIVNEKGMPKEMEKRQYLGSVIPDFTGGIRNTFSYKGITLAALFDFQKGGIIHSASLLNARYSGMLPETAEGNIREEGIIINGVMEDGSPNTIVVDPLTFYQDYFGVASENVYDGDYLKFRELRLSYTLPKALLGSLPFRDVTFGFVGRNLAIIYSDLPYLDPQAVTGTGNIQGLENAQVPSTRSLGFNLSFKL